MVCDVLSARVVHMQCGQHSPVSITGDLPHSVKFFNVVRQACGGYVVKLQGLSTYPRQARQSQAWVTGEPGNARLSTPSRCGQAGCPARGRGTPFAPMGWGSGGGCSRGLFRKRKKSYVKPNSARVKQPEARLVCAGRCPSEVHPILMSG